jgi:exopolysaccharide production protein ExoQ
VLIVFAVGIAGLFWLERDRKSRTSLALLLPLFWMLIAGSRNVGEWLQMGQPSDSGDAYIDGNPIDRNLLSVLIGLGVFILYKRRRAVGALLRANVPLILYFAYCLISISWSDFPLTGLKRWVRAVGDIVMVLVVLTEQDWFLAKKRLYAWTGFVLLPLSLMLIRYFPEVGRSYSVFDGEVFWTGVTETKNELGMICMLFGLGSLARVLDIYSLREGIRSKSRLLAHGFIVLLAVYLLRIANSATSKACFAIGTVLLVATSWKVMAKKPLLVQVLVVSLLGAGVSSLFLGLGSGLVNGLGRNSTLTGRTEMWGEALALVENPVFGAGYESFWVGSRLEKMKFVAPGVNQAHNAYLEVYLNLGWIGVILLGTLIVTSYRKLFAAFKRDPDRARLGLTYFMVALSYGFTEGGSVKFRNPVWISFLISVVATSLISSRRVQRLKSSKLPGSDEIDIASVEAAACAVDRV